MIVARGFCRVRQSIPVYCQDEINCLVLCRLFCCYPCPVDAEQ
jgi:hypothetical protein